MCDTILINNLISGGMGLIGVYIGYRLSWNNIKRQDVKKASADFRNAFVECLFQLEDSPKDKPAFTFVILRQHYPLHCKAYISFCAVLTKPDRLTLKKAWNQYCYAQDGVANMSPDDKKNILFRRYESAKSEDELTKCLLAIHDITSLSEFKSGT